MGLIMMALTYDHNSLGFDTLGGKVISAERLSERYTYSRRLNETN